MDNPVAPVDYPGRGREHSEKMSKFNRPGHKCARAARRGLASPNGSANRASPDQTGPSARSPALRGEVAERSNAPHSKCGVRATVPWVRIPPSPPRTPSTGLVYQVSAVNPRCSAGFHAAIRNRGALRVPVFAPPGRVWRGPSPRGSTSVRFPCFADITGKIAKTRAKNREVKAD